MLKGFWNKIPVLVYQMGKVGSNTVFDYLKCMGRLRVYHVHFLSPNNIKDVRRSYIKTNNIIPYIKLFKNVVLYQQCVRQLAQEKPIHIVSMVRDPIARDISDLFHNMVKSHPQLIRSDQTISEDATVRFLTDMFNNYSYNDDYACTWFDKELKDCFHVDVFKYRFDWDKGYTIIREGNINVLIIRLENISRSLQEALSVFFEEELVFPDMDVPKKNNADLFGYSLAYNSICRCFRLPRTTCQHIYNSPYALHFYSPSERLELMDKWSAESG